MTDKKPTILIGNGINSAFNEWAKSVNETLGWFEQIKARFTYAEISSKQKIPGEERTICEKYGVTETDIEKILTNLNKDKKDELKGDFIKVLDKMHPNLTGDLIKAIKNEEKRLKLNFKFKSIYTINFDLKLYYLFNILDLFGHSELPDRYRDGFSQGNNTPPNLTYSKDMPNINYIYLHGAMHILQNSAKEERVIKVRNMNGTYNLCYHAKAMVDDNENLKRLFVIGGTSYDKQLTIQNKSEYLKRSLQSLSKTSGDFVIYGCSMEHNDQHIWNKINSIPTDQIKKIYVGTCLGDKSELVRIQSLFPEKRLHFYCQKKFNIWSCENWFKKICNNSQAL